MVELSIWLRQTEVVAEPIATCNALVVLLYTVTPMALFVVLTAWLMSSRFAVTSTGYCTP